MACLNPFTLPSTMTWDVVHKSNILLQSTYSKKFNIIVAMLNFMSSLYYLLVYKSHSPLVAWILTHDALGMLNGRNPC